MKTILKDVAILWVLTFIGGLILGVGLGAAGVQGPSGQIAIGLSNVLFSIVGFCISGASAKINRFNHLIKVAIAFWLINAINIVVVHVSITQWVSSLPITLIAMGIGGGISFLFSPSPTISPNDPA